MKESKGKDKRKTSVRSCREGVVRGWWCGRDGGAMGNRGASNDHLRGRIFSEQSWV